MNIAFITPKLTLGGYERVVVNYANAFSKKGHHITLLCGFKEGDLISELSSEIAVIDFHARFRNFIFPLVKYLKEHEVDILYVPYRSYTCVAVLARALSGNKNCIIYSTEHGYVKESKFIELLEGAIMKKADVLSALTLDMARYEAQALHIPVERYICLTNPVFDGDKVVSANYHKWLGENKECPVIVVSGRLEEDKNIDIAIQILKEVLKQTNAKMIIMGNGRKMDDLQSLARRLAVDDAIDFLGHVSNPMGYMIQCDLLLHTCVLEGFGNVVAEALYCNLPVVTTACKGPEEIIEHGKYGVVIGDAMDKNVVERGASAIIKIILGEIKFTGMNEKAKRYDANNLEKEFLTPYYECIQKNV